MLLLRFNAPFQFRLEAGMEQIAQKSLDINLKALVNVSGFGPLGRTIQRVGPTGQLGSFRSMQSAELSADLMTEVKDGTRQFWAVIKGIPTVIEWAEEEIKKLLRGEQADCLLVLL